MQQRRLIVDKPRVSHLEHPGGLRENSTFSRRQEPRPITAITPANLDELTVHPLYPDYSGYRKNLQTLIAKGV